MACLLSSARARSLLLVLCGLLVPGAFVACQHAYGPLPTVPPATPKTDPAVDVQVRLLQEAHLAYVKGNYELAVRRFKRFSERFPLAARAPEARWWAARSYEALGEGAAALEEYRTLAAAASSSQASVTDYGVLAMRRLEVLRTGGGGPSGERGRLIGLYVGPDDVPKPDARDAWLDGLATAGVSLVVMEIGTSASVKAGGGTAGVYFPSVRAALAEDLYAPLVAAAHQRGVSVFGTISLEQMGWVGAQTEWGTLLADPTTMRSQLSSTYDLGNASFQTYVSGLVADLAKTGVDGLLVKARKDSSFGYEYSPALFGSFQASFGLPSVGEEVFQPVAPAEGADVSNSRVKETRSPLFWRWVGWKARLRLSVLQRVREAALREGAAFRLAVEVHPATLANPLEGLLVYGEDVAEARARGFDVVVLPLARGPGEQFDPDAELRTLIQRLIADRPTTSRLWVKTIVPPARGPELAWQLKSRLEALALPEGVHVLFVSSIEPIVP